jgi:hypothetical protein
MFFRKVAVVVLCCMCATAVAYAQKSLPMYGQRDLPMPQDPEKTGTMMLTRTDMRLKAQAEDYLHQGTLDSAVQVLQGISNQWVSHWFLSYAYEMNLLYKEALSENDWLLQKSQRKDLTIELTERKQMLEREIRDANQDADPQPQKKGLIIF